MPLRSHWCAHVTNQLEAAEAAVRSAEAEARVLAHVADSLRAELREQQAANETLRSSMVTKVGAGLGQTAGTQAGRRLHCWVRGLVAGSRMRPQ